MKIKSLIILFLLICYGYSDTTAFMKKVIISQPIQYLPLNDTSDSIANDLSGNSRNGTHNAGVLLNQSGFKNGEKSVYYNGSGASTNIYNASLYSTFKPDSGSLMLFLQSSGGTYWGGNSGTVAIIRLYGDGNSSIQLHAATSTRQIIAYYQSTTYNACTASTLNFGTVWHCIILTWHKPTNKFRMYIDGTRGSSKFSVMAGVWTASSFGTGTTTLGQASGLYFMGKISHYALWNKVLTKKQIVDLSDTLHTYSLTGFGDSYTTGAGATTVPNMYINRLATLLKANIVQNSGYSGTVLQDSVLANNGRSRFLSDVYPYESDYNILLYGTNDAHWDNGTSLNIRNFTHDYREVIQGLLDSGYTKEQLILGNLPLYDTTHDWSSTNPRWTIERHREYNDTIKKLSKEFNIKFANVFDAMRLNGGLSLIYPDYLHANDSGHMVIANAFYAARYLSLSTTGSRWFNFLRNFGFGRGR